jgi:hypothetical protein
MPGFRCGTCGEWHDELPLTFAADAPYSYFAVPSPERDERTVLTSDQCIIDEEQFFIRGQLEIPFHGQATPFIWGVWVEVSSADFERMGELWETVGRENEPPYNVRVDTALPLYGPTTGLNAELITRPVGMRPSVRLTPTDHPLFKEQRDGVPLERVRAVAAAVMHGSS